jgi:hypothetical protein
MKKDLNSVEYWDHFGRGILLDRPNPKEAAEKVISLLVENARLKREIAEKDSKLKIAAQQFSVFAMEVANNVNKMAAKYFL